MHAIDKGIHRDFLNTGQKGKLENKHIELLYMLPKGTDLNTIGLADQNSLNLALSHVNFSLVEKLGGRSPLELADLIYHYLYEKLVSFAENGISDVLNFKDSTSNRKPQIA